MQPDSAPAASTAELKDSPSASPAERANRNGHIFFQAVQGLLYLHLPPANAMAVEWSHLWEQLQQRLDSSAKIWPPNTSVCLMANDRLLDPRQFDQLASALSGANLRLQRVVTSRRQTAISAVTAGYSVEQQSPALRLSEADSVKFAHLPVIPVLAEPLFLETTLRSGTEVRHPGSVVVVGDVNPGSAIVADGNILVWGRLRGIAHAGANGDRDCQIMALQMEPTQLRIADQVARSPEKAPNQFYPEVASIGSEGIQITRASEVLKHGRTSKRDAG
ncbi:septum site-determining protein MinC [Altericista sp. CCNU0014]|uniref:septum site-determining protein MinC n=1 Tax=Altericista sp. CCNU0014 TaxID=3082949 RepID=UPI00384A4B8F